MYTYCACTVTGCNMAAGRGGFGGRGGLGGLGGVLGATQEVAMAMPAASKSRRAEKWFFMLLIVLLWGISKFFAKVKWDICGVGLLLLQCATQRRLNSK